jgi:hypothetical protein
VHIWFRSEPEAGWEQQEILDAGLTLGIGPAGRLEFAPGASERAPAVIMPFHENRVRRAALLTRGTPEPCLLNGFPPLAAAVLEDRDELVVGREVAYSAAVLEDRDELVVGREVAYFGSFGAAVGERFAEAAGPAPCARCKGAIAPGDAVTRCPACRAPHHEGALAGEPDEVRRCFSYFGEPCAACGRSAAELVWSPEEVWR